MRRAAHLVWLIAGSLALTGCEPADPETNVATVNRQLTSDNRPDVAAPSGNRFHDQVAALGDEEREAILAKFKTASGETCASVSRSMYLGMEQQSKQAFWNVRCDGGEDWLVSIQADSSTSLLDCATYARLGERCWQKFE